MKTKILITILLIAFSIQHAQASQPILAGQTGYDEYLIHYVGDKVYVNYWHNWNDYKIRIPSTRTEFIRLEFAYTQGALSETDVYYKTVQLNMLLVKKWLEPLYY